MSLSSFDDAIDALSKPADLANLPARGVPNGFYTLTFPSGEHRTFRIRTEPGGKFKGRRTLGILIGPDNTAEYESFAFIEDAGPSVWKRFKNQKQAQYAMVIWSIVNGEEIDGYELKISKRCLACNRPLTTPESLETGYGPSCRERLGL